MRRIQNPANRLRLGFVGGGLDSGIGSTHRYAAHLDGHFELVAGVFSSNEQRNWASADAYGIDAARVYPDFATMARKEAARPDRIDAVAIMAPNALHVPASRAFVEAGIAVICDKPLATHVAEARDLAAEIERRNALFVLTHNYSGYPMVREARSRIAAGEIGEVRLVQVEHAAAFGVRRLETQAVKSLMWRTDPANVGASAVLADVGTHAHQLARYITGLEVTEVAAELTTMVAGRESDDNAHAMLRFDSGARGMLWASFVAAGNRQGLQIRVYGTTGSLAWQQEAPDQLMIRPQDAPHFALRRGETWLGEAASRATRVKAGQPEGILEAFANIYSDAAELIRARLENRSADPYASQVPGVTDGVRGMCFVDAAVRSSQAEGAWTTVHSPEE
ncbi:Predicted dehydrogenase [Burkholderia sp. OK233]|nr:Predicted dehydrogenase [Burkholderia sp. OK233]